MRFEIKPKTDGKKIAGVVQTKYSHRQSDGKKQRKNQTILADNMVVMTGKRTIQRKWLSFGMEHDRARKESGFVAIFHDRRDGRTQAAHEETFDWNGIVNEKWTVSRFLASGIGRTTLSGCVG